MITSSKDSGQNDASKYSTNASKIRLSYKQSTTSFQNVAFSRCGYIVHSQPVVIRLDFIRFTGPTIVQPRPPTLHRWESFVYSPLSPSVYGSSFRPKFPACASSSSCLRRAVVSADDNVRLIMSVICLQ